MTHGTGWSDGEARDMNALHLQTPAGRLASGTGRGLVAYGAGRSRWASRSTRWPEPAALATAYAGCGAVATAASAALGRDPFTCDGWLGTTGAPASLLSLGLGVLVVAATVAATHAMVKRFRWARDLGAALRPPAQYSGEAALVAVAVASAAGEELLFRGLLVPVVGVVAPSVVFGALHQVRGPGRWGWMLWATLMGLAFGAVFAATGSLAGPLVAHAAINHANLRFLRDTRPPTPRTLGGLLRR
jgi:membrane protease YdiL (CAAX protease family)